MSLSRRSMALAGVALAASGGARAEGNESTFERVKRIGTLRIAALPGELPYFTKDLATGEWKGAAIEFARDIAKVFDAKLEYIESTYGGSVLDLQSNKIDLAFALGPTPQRALSIAFTRPFFNHPYGCLAKKGFNPATWARSMRSRPGAMPPARRSRRTRRGTRRHSRSSRAGRMYSFSRLCSAFRPLHAIVPWARSIC